MSFDNTYCDQCKSTWLPLNIFLMHSKWCNLWLASADLFGTSSSVSEVTAMLHNIALQSRKYTPFTTYRDICNKASLCSSSEPVGTFNFLPLFLVVKYI